MNRVIAPLAAAPLVLVLALALAVPSPASAATRHWRVSATLSGSYDNAVTATPAARCGARYAEAVHGLRATFTSRRALSYDTVAHAFAGTLRYRINNAKWAVTGGYVAQVAQPDGTLGCAATETPVACSARVVFEDGHRTSTTGSARLEVDDNAGSSVISRIAAPRLTEQYADAGAPPAGWPAACLLTPGDEAVPAGPLFGLSTSQVLDRALAARIRFPARRLAGHSKFIVKVPPARPAGCPAQGFDPCVEHGSFALRVTVTPAG